MGNRTIKPRRALLIDFENMLYEGGVRVDYMRASARLTETLRLALPVQHKLVAARPWALAAHIPLLTAHDLPVELAPKGPDGADYILIERGLFLAGTGYTEFIIATRDHIFADFANAHATIVIAPCCHAPDPLRSRCRPGPSHG